MDFCINSLSNCWSCLKCELIFNDAALVGGWVKVGKVDLNIVSVYIDIYGSTNKDQISFVGIKSSSTTIEVKF